MGAPPFAIFKGWGFRFNGDRERKCGVQPPTLAKTARMGHPRDQNLKFSPRVQNLKFNFPSSARRGGLARYLLAEARVDLQRVALENLSLILGAEPRNPVNVALRVVEVVSCFRIDALDRADHFRREQNVVGGNNFREQVDPGLVVAAGSEINVVEQ